MSITRNVKTILSNLPHGVMLVAAAKTRNVDELKEAILAGVIAFGENYIQEAEQAYSELGDAVRWHCIGHLQRNKVKKAVQIFDMIETVDSLALAKEIDKRCKAEGKIMDVLLEVNSACEGQKNGVMPHDIKALIHEICLLGNVKIKGLMTMGPWLDDPEKIRPYFRLTKELFDEIKNSHIDNVEMEYLSMGMSDSYKIAIEEGANIVRVGTALFGERKLL